MSRLLGTLFYYIAKFWGWVLRLTPQFLLDAVASMGAVLWFDLVGFRRKIVLQNLAHAFPRRPEEASTEFRDRIHRLARLNFKNYFLGFFEVLQKTTWSYSYLKKKVRFIGMEHVREAMVDGKGVFMLAAHIGNWEVSLAMANWVEKPMSVIVRHVRNSFWDQVLHKSRRKFDVNLLPETSSGVAAMRAYKRGEMVVFVVDQHTGEPHGILAQFFGMPAWSAKGLAILASRLNATVLPSYSYRENGEIYVVIEKPLEVSDLGECREEAQLREYVQRCNDKIEEWVRKYPEQYFWIHRRFKASIDYRHQKLPFP